MKHTLVREKIPFVLLAMVAAGCTWGTVIDGATGDGVGQASVVFQVMPTSTARGIHRSNAESATPRG